MPTESSPVAIITGGAKRIGAACAERFHAAGFEVVIHCNDSEAEAAALCAALERQRADSVRVVRGNLSARPPYAIAADLKGAFGRADVLVNNAAQFPDDEQLGHDLDAWRALFTVNALAPYRLAQELSTALAARHGAIVNLLDIRVAQLNPPPDYALYAASKAALHSLSISLAKQLAGRVRVNAVAPGMITPSGTGSADWEPAEVEAIRARIPAGKPGTPADVANAVFMLAHLNHVTGHTLQVSGGEELAW